MYVFNYDPQTLEYLGAEPSEYDQLEPGRLIVPAWATATPPPKEKDGFIRAFVLQTDSWRYIPIEGEEK